MQVASEPLFADQLQGGDPPHPVDIFNPEIGNVLVPPLVDVAPVTDRRRNGPGATGSNTTIGIQHLQIGENDLLNLCPGAALYGA